MKQFITLACRLLLITLIMGAAAVAALPIEISIIQDQNVKPYQQTVEAFKTTIREIRPDIEFVQAEKKAASLIFTLGISSLRNLHSDLADNQLLATMIFDSENLQNHPKATAVLLNISIEKQLQWHSRILPMAKRIGVLYDPQYNQQWVEEAKLSANKLGLEIIAIPVNSPQELPAALKSLSRNADSILGIIDQTVYSSSTAKAVLLFSFRNRIPFVGISAAWVKAGALYALDWDYSELGRQCATLALDILAGKKTSMLREQRADKIHYLLNMKTAKQMKIMFNQELLDGASKVYE